MDIKSKKSRKITQNSYLFHVASPEFVLCLHYRKIYLTAYQRLWLRVIIHMSIKIKSLFMT